MKQQYLSRCVNALLIFLLGISLSAKAADEPYENMIRGTALTPGAVLTTADPVFGAPSWSSQTAYGVQNVVQFEIDFDNAANSYFHNLTFSAICNVDITCYGNPGSPGSITQTYAGIQLQVNYNPATGASYKGIANYKFNGAYKVEVRVNSITPTGIVLATHPIFKLTNKMLVTRQYTFNDNTADVLRYYTDGTKLTVAWVPTAYPGAESFDLEWTYVDSGSNAGLVIAGGSANAALLESYFRNNSSRVNLSASSYIFNLNYNKGYILFRVRGVQFRQTDGIRLEGNWNYQASALVGSTYSNPQGLAYVFVPWHEEKLNWQYNAVYAEDGKKKEVISYFDGSLRSRQTVTLNNADNVSVVAEPVYDALGRTAMSILPAPVQDNKLQYYRSFNVNTSFKPVSYRDIPSANCGVIAAPLSSTSGVERYYSANNPFLSDVTKPWHQAIPKSDSFPFTVTQYTPDNTGRIRAQGGVGRAFQLGTGRETKYFYGKPTQYELDRLFGAEAGDHTHYLKNMSVDGNGQVSVSYQNSEGKTVATAMAGIKPDNMEALASSTPPTSTVKDVLLTPSSFQINTSRSSLEATSTFLVSSTGDYKFTYRFTPEQYKENFSGGVLCYTCSYNLLITIKDDCGNELKREEKTPVTPFNISCAAPAPLFKDMLVPITKVGEYTAYFELVVNKDTLDKYTADYLVRNTDIKKLNYFLLQQLVEENMAECYSDCEACKTLPEDVEDFVKKIEAYYSQEGLPFGDPEREFSVDLYHQIKEQCHSISRECVVSPCEETREILKADVTPGGQYAEFDSDYQLVDPEINVLRFYNQVSYLDEDGNPAQVEDANGSMISPAQLSLKDFIMNFEDSWANSLVQYHPEYCYYEWCMMNEESQRFSQTIEELNDAIEAQTGSPVYFVKGDPLQLLSQDPFFNGGYGTGFYGEMKDDLQQYSVRVLGLTAQSNKDILQTIDYLLYCGNQDPAISWDDCNKDPKDACRSDYKEWLLYKGWYLDLKLKYYTKAMHERFPECKNCFIPSSGGGDPTGWLNCIAPPVTDFTVDTVANTSVDGLRRILVKYRGGNEIANWPLTIDVLMIDPVAGISLTQSVVLTPGFGTQEMIVQSGFTQFVVSRVACAQIETERMGGGKLARRSSNTKTSLVNGGQARPGKGGIFGVWDCPTADDIAVSGIGTSVLNVCYGNMANMPMGRSFTVYLNVVVRDCPSCPAYRVPVKVDFCYIDRPANPFCQSVILSGTILEVEVQGIKCDEANCDGRWECPGKDLFTVNYTQDEETRNFPVTVCYTGPAIPAGKQVVIRVEVETGCGSRFNYDVTFCAGGPICNTRVLNYEEVCGKIYSVSISRIECHDKACEFRCPTPDGNDFSFTVTNSGFPTFQTTVKVCYTGVPIPAGKKIKALVSFVKGLDCGNTLTTFDAEFCSNSTCFSYSFMNRNCSVEDLGIKEVECGDGTCAGNWQCPIDANFTVTTVPNGSGTEVRICYTGPAIPAGTIVTVYSSVTTGCGVQNFETVFCSNKPNCQSLGVFDICGYESIAIERILCSERPCEWECPKVNDGLFTFQLVPTGFGSSLQICYTGAPIPAGTIIRVRGDIMTNCDVRPFEVTFCNNKPTCQEIAFFDRTVCQYESAVVNDISCERGECKWECPKDGAAFTFRLVPTGFGTSLQICYAGAPIPAGTIVRVQGDIVTECGIRNFNVTFCGTNPPCQEIAFFDRTVCQYETAYVTRVECEKGECNWQCPTDGSLFTFQVVPCPPGMACVDVQICYNGSPIPAGKKIYVSGYINTPCGPRAFTATFCSDKPYCQSIYKYDRTPCYFESGVVQTVYCKDEPCWECPTNPAVFTFQVVPCPPGLACVDVQVCYTGPAIPAGKKINISGIINTPCGPRPFTASFCSDKPYCQSVYRYDRTPCYFESGVVQTIDCKDAPCWECPVDKANYTVTKTLNPVTRNWEVKVCYTGPAIPPNKTVTVPVTIYSEAGCIEKPIQYEVQFCQGISCNTRILNPADLRCESFEVRLGEVRCADAPCSAPCPDEKEFSAAVNGALAGCTSIAGGQAVSVRVNHIGGALPVVTPERRVKVKVEIKTQQSFPARTYIDYKYVWFNGGDTYKDICFHYPQGRGITSVKVVEIKCAGPCPPGDCCDDPRYSLYEGKVRRFQDYVAPDFAAIMATYNSGSTNFSGYPLTTCKNECEALADSWILDLKNCVNATPQKLERVRRKLVDVCKQSCEAQRGNDNIYPYSDVNPTPSFEDVIIAEFGSLTANCAYDLISDPYPWGKNPKGERTFAVETNDAFCAKLHEFKAEAAANGYGDVHKYLQDFYKPYYDLDEDELNDLFKACDDCKNILNLPVELPLFMDGDAKPCLTCDEYERMVADFNAKYPGVTPAHDKYDILFRNYINHRTGFSHAFANYYEFGFNCERNNDDFRRLGHLCELPVQMEIDINPITQCMDEKFYNALANATVIYTAYIEEVKRVFRNNYTAKCLSAKPRLESEAKLYEYHYTLYYYDQSDNLVKTIPPKGVDMLTDAQITALQADRTQFIAPVHTLATTYEYNSFNQVIKQYSPDAGTSEFWYDRLGRLVASQNAEQRSPANGGSTNRYSYTKYEQLLSRITEVGEKSGANIAGVEVRSDAALQAWFASGTDAQITETFYDQANTAVVTNTAITSQQQNYTSRKRVTATLFKKQRDPDITKYDAATHYSYDINGNAKVVWQESARLKTADASTQGLKRFDYEFDLVSGKVNKVYYQKGKGDQFIYKYEYDAENRVTGALSSRDGLLWQNDAGYKYYLHGPLARTEVGTLKVQGMDYAYTLQGWMKHINAPVLSERADIGRDGDIALAGNIFSRVSRDVLGYTISYFNGEYSPIQPGSALNFTENIPGALTGSSLYNGNIRATTLQVAQLGTPKTYSYSYDQLNRIVKMRKHETTYTPPAGAALPVLNLAAATDEYREDIGYDPNGNITAYLRNGTAAQLAMDSLSYKYLAGTNQLNYVKDNVLPGNYAEDIDGQTTGNYTYDKIGNLVKDDGEKIGNIEWTVYGKINKITKTDAGATTIEYEYDAGGHRIYKKVTTSGTGASQKYTYYIRDAQGNTMALYTRTNSDPVQWAEQHLYGSSRIGMLNINTTVGNSPNPAPGAALPDGFDYGKTVYELNNHLGNVLATISDKKLGVQNGSTGTVAYFSAEVMTATDYYPFGMAITGRTYTATTSYRYGFNGQEKEYELNENITTAEFWEYDTRIGIRWNIDPKLKVWESPYMVMSGNPIFLNDPLGDVPPGPGDPTIVFGLKVSVNFKTHKLILTDAFIKSRTALGKSEWAIESGITLNKGAYLGVSSNNSINLSGTLFGSNASMTLDGPVMVGVGFKREGVKRGLSPSIGVNLIVAKRPDMAIFKLKDPNSPISPTNIPQPQFPSSGAGSSAQINYLGIGISLPTPKLFSLPITTYVNQDLGLPPGPKPETLGDIPLVNKALQKAREAYKSLNIPSKPSVGPINLLGKEYTVSYELDKEVDKQLEDIKKKKVQEMIKKIFDKIKETATKQ